MAGAALSGAAAVHLYRTPGPASEARVVLLPRVGGTPGLAQVLARTGLIDRTWVFEAAATVTAARGGLHGGEKRFPARASLAQILDVLRNGKVVEHKVTFAEGLSAAQISRILAQDAGLDGELVMPDEGSVLPETYLYERPATVASVLRRASQAGEVALRDAWDERAAGLPLRSAREALILASIVERETHLAAERPMVAAVFVNRLRAGMRLQADPTTAYGAGGGLGRLDRLLAKDDLERDDPYNTYVIGGLPAGPICSPGRASVLAVLHPAQTDALYFVANGSGGHSFAATLEEHAKNVSRYRRLPR